MTAATDYLNAWIQTARVRDPSVTRATCQRWPGVGPPPHFKPGIASYGWGINGSLMKDAANAPIGIAFSNVYVWFSDRGLDLSNAPPNSGQQFAPGEADHDAMYLTVEGDSVRLRNVLRTWNTEFTVETTTFDEPSQQLVFSVPGAGPGAPSALMIVSFADTGSFAWL